MASLRDLGGAAAQLLQLFSEQLIVAGVELPEIQYVAPGSIPAWDGEMLIVNLLRLEQGQPGAPQGGTMFRATYSAQFAVSLIRVIPALFNDGPVGNAMIPSAEDLGEAGVGSFDDAGALILAATAIHEGFLFTDPGEGFEVGPCSAIGPQGGLSGHQILISTSVS